MLKLCRLKLFLDMIRYVVRRCAGVMLPVLTLIFRQC